ncbi:hypothetical protein DFS34DRAFT_261359 [Phlyctochytrium arcticum]|nr:hypothetical protein DFS34DRAFT_261359 [Phlyctochytrium arcticum]
MPRSPNVVTDFIDLTLEEETEDEYPSPRPFFELPRVVDLTDPPPVKRGTKRRRVPSDHWLDHEYYETTETDSYGSSSREFEARPQNNQGTSFQIGTYNLGLKTVDPRKAYTGSFEDDDDVLDDEIIPIEITPEVVENDESGVTLDITEDTENRHFNQSVVHEVDDQDINRKLLVFDDAWDDGGSESMDISSSSGSAGESSRGEGTPEILRRSTPIRTWIKFDVERKDNEVEENENEENSPVDVDLGEMGAVGNEDRDDEVMEVDNECLQDELVEVNDECDAIEDVGNEGLEDETEDMDNEGLEDETEDMENEGLEDETEDMENKGLEEDETEDADDEILCWGKVDVREVEKNQQVNWSVTAGVAEGGANGAEKGDRTPPNTSAMVKRNLDVGIDPTMLSPKRALTVAKSKNRHREVDEISDLSSVPASCREVGLFLLSMLILKSLASHYGMDLSTVEP